MSTETKDRDESFARTLYWSARPGRFTNKLTGEPVTLVFNDDWNGFTGSVREWYETLVETLFDLGRELPEGILTLHCCKQPTTRSTRSILEASVMFILSDDLWPGSRWDLRIMGRHVPVLGPTEDQREDEIILRSRNPKSGVLTLGRILVKDLSWNLSP